LRGGDHNGPRRHIEDEEDGMMIVQADLIQETCPNCGVLYAIPETLHAKGIEYKAQRSIYCPNGHAWHYTGTTHAQQLQQAQEKANALASQLQEERRIREMAEKRIEGMKRRSAAGTCQFCKRTFSQLSKHVINKHPEQAEACRLKSRRTRK